MGTPRRERERERATAFPSRGAPPGLRSQREATTMYDRAQQVFQAALEEIRAAGTFKEERILASPQGAAVRVQGREVLNFCANNYLGLSSHPAVLAGARRALEERGFGLSSVRFICGTQDLHKDLEARLAAFFGFEGAVLFGSCFD